MIKSWINELDNISTWIYRVTHSRLMCRFAPPNLFVTSLASNLRDGLGIADGWLSPICPPGLIGTGHELGHGLGPDMM